MHLSTIALTLFAALVSAGDGTIVVYSDGACQTQIGSYSSADSNEGDCSSLPSGIMSYEIQNDDKECAAEPNETLYSIYGEASCGGTALDSTCYLSCNSVGDADLQSWRWETVSGDGKRMKRGTSQE